MKTPPEIPRHVAIIMDGNGRWAKQQSLLRMRGHREGVKSVRAVTQEAVRQLLDTDPGLEQYRLTEQLVQKHGEGILTWWQPGA